MNYYSKIVERKLPAPFHGTQQRIQDQKADQTGMIEVDLTEDL